MLSLYLAKLSLTDIHIFNIHPTPSPLTSNFVMIWTSTRDRHIHPRLRFHGEDISMSSQKGSMSAIRSRLLQWNPLNTTTVGLFKFRRIDGVVVWGVGVPLYWLAVCVINFHTGITKQARDRTYAGQNHPYYDKGHLLPAQTYSFTDDYMRSTFTYTNAVPQIAGFNRGQWAKHERKIRKYAKKTCSPKGGDLYLITGISEVSLQNNGRAIQEIPLKVLKPRGDAISIPRSMWTAGCCIVPSRGVLGAFAVIGNNRQDKSKVFMSQVKMTKLKDCLRIGVQGFGGAAIDLFPAIPGCSYPRKRINLWRRPATE